MLAHNHVSQFLFDKLAINTWTRGLKEPGILMNRFKDARNWNYVGGAITQFFDERLERWSCDGELGLDVVIVDHVAT